MDSGKSIYTVVLTKEIALKARVAAAERNQSRSALIRDLLTQHFDKHDQQTGNGATVQHGTSNQQ